LLAHLLRRQSQTTVRPDMFDVAPPTARLDQMHDLTTLHRPAPPHQADINSFVAQFGEDRPSRLIITHSPNQSQRLPRDRRRPPPD
jgi:hypothetical protein